MTDRSLISLDQAARRLGLLPSTVRAAVGRGLICADVQREGTLWFRPEVIDRYGQALRGTSAPPMR